MNVWENRSTLQNPEKKKLWDEAAARIETITDRLGLEIDEGIKEVVIAFLVNGFPTQQSCEGHLEERFGAIRKINPGIMIGVEEPKIRFVGEGEIKQKFADQFGVTCEGIDREEEGCYEAARAYWNYIAANRIPETAQYQEVRVNNDELLKRFQGIFAEFLQQRPDCVSALTIDKVGPGGLFKVGGSSKAPDEIQEDKMDIFQEEFIKEQKAMKALGEFLKQRFWRN